MAYSIQIDEKSKHAKAFLEFVKNLDFVLGVHKMSEKEQIAHDLADAFNDVKLHKEGKIKLKSAKNLLDEL
jgi:hypothetical protein